MALMIVSVAMGTALLSCLLSIALDIKARVASELRQFGANITVEPSVEGLADIASQRRYLREEDLPKSKTIFWRYNIVGVAPFLHEKVFVKAASGEKTLEVTAAGTWFDKEMAVPGGGGFRAGIWSVAPWWEIKGAPPQGRQEVAAGAELALKHGIKPGDELLVDGEPFRVSGIVSVGGPEDGQVFFDLAALQAMKGRQGKLSKVLVSALTSPMDEFAYRDPATMSPKEYEKWYCTGYVTSIAKQLEEVFVGSKARPLWNVAYTEGRVLGRLSALVYLLTAFALIASALGVSTTMVAGLLKRTGEIALMKSIGADGFKTALVFLCEAAVIGFMGGIAGYLLSLVAVRFIGLEVFGTELTRRAMLLPVSLTAAQVISLAGSLIAVRKALLIKPALMLKEVR